MCSVTLSRASLDGHRRAWRSPCSHGELMDWEDFRAQLQLRTAYIEAWRLRPACPPACLPLLGRKPSIYPLHPPPIQSEFNGGEGTYVRDSYLCASLVGLRCELPAGEGESKPTLVVARSGDAPVVPAVGDVVTARVTKINPRLAAVDILCVGSQPVQQRYSGVIRVQVPAAARQSCGCRRMGCRLAYATSV